MFPSFSLSRFPRSTRWFRRHRGFRSPPPDRRQMAGDWAATGRHPPFAERFRDSRFLRFHGLPFARSRLRVRNGFMLHGLPVSLFLDLRGRLAGARGYGLTTSARQAGKPALRSRTDLGWALAATRSKAEGLGNQAATARRPPNTERFPGLSIPDFPISRLPDFSISRFAWALHRDLDPLAQVGRNVEILPLEEIPVGLVEVAPALHLGKREFVLLGSGR